MSLHFLPLTYIAVFFVAYLSVKKGCKPLRKRHQTHLFWKKWKAFYERHSSTSTSKSINIDPEARHHFYKLLETLQQIVECGSMSTSFNGLESPISLNLLEKKLHKVQYDREGYVDKMITPLIRLGILYEFEPLPLASGLIAQIHKANFLDRSHVVVKVRHEQVKNRLMSQYTELLDFASFLIQNNIELGIYATEVLNKYIELLEEETNLANEANNYLLMSHLLSNYQCSNHGFAQSLKIPKVFPTLCNENLLVMEYINGISFLDAKDLDTVMNLDNQILDKMFYQEAKELLLKPFLNFFGFLILRKGWFPCDPHVSNLMICRHHVLQHPQLVMIDFGQVAHISTTIRLKLAQIILALASEDQNAIAKALTDASSVTLSISPMIATLYASLLFDTASTTPLATNQEYKDSSKTLDKLQFPLEFYFVIRVIGILRNVIHSFGFDLSIVPIWKDIALQVFEEHTNSNRTDFTPTHVLDHNSSHPQSSKSAMPSIDPIMESEFSFPSM